MIASPLKVASSASVLTLDEPEVAREQGWDTEGSEHPRERFRRWREMVDAERSAEGGKLWHAQPYMPPWFVEASGHAGLEQAEGEEVHVRVSYEEERLVFARMLLEGKRARLEAWRAQGGDPGEGDPPWFKAALPQPTSYEKEEALWVEMSAEAHQEVLWG